MKAPVLRKLLARALLAGSLVTGLTACQTSGSPSVFMPDLTLDDSSAAPVRQAQSADSTFPRRRDATSADLTSNVGEPAPILVRGTDDLPIASVETRSLQNKNGEYVLNFDNADIRSVLKSVLTDMLGVSYIVDPAVQGAITLRTAKPIPRSAVLPAFEEALKLSGAALVPGTSGYQVVPLTGAAQRAAIGVAGNDSGPGYQVRVVPLKFVSAADVQRVLEPLVPPGTVVPVNASNANLITLAGTGADVERAERAVAMFDVNSLRSQSFGLFPLHYSSAAAIAEGLNSIVGKQGPMAGAVRIAPITHLNAILVVSRNYSHIEEMRAWIERFDRGQNATKSKLFVYYVQNGKAKDLAGVLTKALSQSKGGSASPSLSPTEDNPGAGSLVSDSSNPLSLGAPSSKPSGATTAMASASTSSIPSVPGSAAPDGVGNDTASFSPDLKITADEGNNALLITTTPERYGLIESALQRLDAAPLQVLLEASIAEVDLTNDLQYGVQASVTKGPLSVLSSAVAGSAFAPSTGGLSAALLASDIQVTLNLLSSVTRVRVISSPKLMVLNNRTAALQVGDQVPVATSSSVSTLVANAPTVNTIQMLDTGIILRVTPRVNRNGRVMMDIAQEVSQSVPTTSSTLNSPTIQQRRVSTSVVVDDGQTVAIGGLIHDNRELNRTGIPWLKDVPGVGALFGQSDDKVDRTELIVLIKPHVIRNGAAADAATSELSAKLPMLQDGFHGTRSH